MLKAIQSYDKCCQNPQNITKQTINLGNLCLHKQSIKTINNPKTTPVKTHKTSQKGEKIKFLT